MELGSSTCYMSKGEKHNKFSDKRDEGSDLVRVAWAILVMGISISLVIIIYIWFGHLASTYQIEFWNNNKKY
jgi:cytoskeletal protein RodZ